MKANAPEKLYISDYGSEVRYNWHPERLAVKDVEYTRTDAFIEKACDTIKSLLSGYIIRNFHFGDSYDMDKLIEDFRKAMKL